ncbi:probable ATP-dependent DNA helicase HFM1 isoform X2 [Halyomorpha halys]|uniref:probable ATP-dependent DNA helicase HFM1 isoform X2 n=1 Tax=Halyomorpha halys TaxID=286706 RepID=UPI0034D17B9D
MAQGISNQSTNAYYFKQVADLPQQYQHVFSSFHTFNMIQSQLMDEILFTDFPIVVSAPTGSGKTVLFELAIVRLLEKCQKEEEQLMINQKILYSPVKALCAERFKDWEFKFRKLGLKAIEVTGDSDEGNLMAIQHFNLVLTTPEKWDSLTRKWRDHITLVEVIKLILIDEVHLLNEERRGSTLEAVVSRMKTIQESLMSNDNRIRFLAVSATIPNIEDVASWLGKKNDPAKFYKFGEEMRPVLLNKVVKTFPFNEKMSYYKFDLNLSYKLKQIVLDYSEGKPALIFCSTRKSVLQTSTILLQNITFHFTTVQKITLEEACQSLLDSKLKEMVKYGVGFHHAGLSASDRHNIEELFKSGFLPILVSTSTLAMGVNLPAHLVIIKSTAQYVNGSWEEYSEGQILQMMGRAGRPQFDSSATAIILTKNTLKEKYEKMVSGNDIVESNLHRNLPEHLNSEIVLGTITDIAVAVNWLRSTFLYVRAMKNPRRYGIPEGLSCAEMEARLQAMCMRELNGLEKYELIKKTDFAYNVEPTENGKLMARLYIAFETMKLFMKLNGKETIPQLLELICQCHEFLDIQLRIDERNTLNRLNKDKFQETIRFPLNGKIKTKEMKINCLIQASLGCLQIPDVSLVQECSKILRITERICKALSLYLWQRKWYEGLASALTITKSIGAKMWENSSYVTRQLPGIGPALASLLAAARKTSFKSIIESNPRDLERIINKHPPMGNSMQEMARSIPQYSLELNYQKFTKKLYVCLKLVNYDKIIDPSHTFSLLVAGCNNELLRKEKIRDGVIIQQKGEINFTINIQPVINMEAVTVHVISEKLVGVDVKKVVAISSQYQFFSKEEGESLYSDEESLVSSNKSFNEKSTSMTVENKNSTKKSTSSQNLLKNTKEKEKTHVKSKYQTSLHQFVFKSSRQQLKHHENEIKNFDDEVSSTQDQTLKYDSLPSSINPVKCSYESNWSSKQEKRAKLDMEYDWYIKKNLEIHKNITKDDGLTHPSSSNYTVPTFQINSDENSDILLPDLQNSQMSKTVVPKLKPEYGSFEKSRPSVIQNANNIQNIIFKHNESHCLDISSNEADNFKTSRQYTSNQRKPLQLSPRQFSKTGKHLPQKINDSRKRKINFFPLFMPLNELEDNMVNTPEDENKSHEKHHNEDSTLVSSGNNVLLSQGSNMNLILGEHDLSDIQKNRSLINQEYMLKPVMKSHSKDNFQLKGEDRIFQNSLNESRTNKDANQLMSTDSSNRVSALEIETPREVTHQSKSENRDISYSQLDDLFHDSPPARRNQDVINPDKSLSSENNNETTRALISLQVDDGVSENNTSDSLSPTFDLYDFTKKELDFGKNNNKTEVLLLDETDTESDVDSLGEDLRHEQKSLRSDYGDPFAPVHDSVTLQRLLEKSRKDDNHKENTSSYKNQQSLEFPSQIESQEDFHTNDDSIGWNKTLASQKGFVSSKNHYEEHVCNSESLYQENPEHNQTLSECFPSRNSDLKNTTVKQFFQIQKELDHKQYPVKYTFNQPSNLSSEIPHCMAIAQPPQEHQAERIPSNIAHNAHSSHKYSVIFDNAPSPQQIEEFKKNMFQNSIFSQKSDTVKNPKSSHSDGRLPRLSHLLFDKKHSPRIPFNNFQTASNLISPMGTSYRSFSEEGNEEHLVRKMNTKLNHEKRSPIPVKSKLVHNEGSISRVNSSINSWPTSLQGSFPLNMANQGFLNFTAQQNHLLQPLIVQERHYYNISACNHNGNNQQIIPDRNINPE